MKRTDLILRLIKEGFTEKTLALLSDKQIKLLSSKVLKEDVALTISQDDLKNIKPENIVNKNIRVVPETEINEYIPKSYVKEEGQVDEPTTKKSPKEVTKKKKKGLVSNTKTPKSGGLSKSFMVKPKNGSVEKLQIIEWLEKIVNEQYYSVTTKNELMGVIKSKIEEQRFSEPDIQTPVKEPQTRPSTPTKDPSKRPLKEPWKTPTPSKNPEPKMEKKTQLPDFLLFNNITNLTKNT